MKVIMKSRPKPSFFSEYTTKHPVNNRIPFTQEINPNWTKKCKELEEKVQRVRHAVSPFECYDEVVREIRTRSESGASIPGEDEAGRFRSMSASPRTPLDFRQDSSSLLLESLKDKQKPWKDAVEENSKLIFPFDLDDSGVWGDKKQRYDEAQAQLDSLSYLTPGKS